MVLVKVCYTASSWIQYSVPLIQILSLCDGVNVPMASTTCSRYNAIVEFADPSEESLADNEIEFSFTEVTVLPMSIPRESDNPNAYFLVNVELVPAVGESINTVYPSEIVEPPLKAHTGPEIRMDLCKGMSPVAQVTVLFSVKIKS